MADEAIPVHLPTADSPPLRRLAKRLGAALGLLLFVALVAFLNRDGYVDAAGDELTLLDALYYATVSVTTTGYGDIRPESDTARLLSILLVTPARIAFLVLLVGATLEVLTERTRTAYRVALWSRRLRDHTIICGYGTKGRAAAATLVGHGVDRSRIVVIDRDRDALDQAREHGLAAVSGSATRTEVLERARIREAGAIVVAPHADDAAVLMTLTARELNPRATIVAAVREEDNAHLLRQGGADSVIVSSGSAGRLLGLATQSPLVVQMLEDLLSVGVGLDIVEREVEPGEVGPLADVRMVDPIIAVGRGPDLMRFDDPRAAELQPGDRLVMLCHRDERSAASLSPDPAASPPPSGPPRA